MTAPDPTEAEVIAVFNEDTRVRSLVKSITRLIVSTLAARKAVAPTNSLLTAHARLVRSRVIRAVCDEFGLTHAQLIGQSRIKSIARPRGVCYWLLRQRSFSYPEIGRAVGGRHHTTVMAMIKSVEADEVLLTRARELLARIP